jgi:putative nucleotidyltransferase with HDIG domain
MKALTIVREYVKNENLIKHMFCVEAAMRFYAEKFGEDVETWGLLGLLHDFDWEVHPTLAEHPSAGAPILRERGVDEDIIQDILSHGMEPACLAIRCAAKRSTPATRSPAW